MDGMGDAQMGATADVMHNVQMGCTDNAWMGATKGIIEVVV